MTNETKRYYRQAREHGCAAHVAIFKARRFIAGPLADYRAKLEAWKAEPDKRRYAPGGIANRPKFPELYLRCGPESFVPDGYRLFGFADSESGNSLSDLPDFGYYADTHCDSTYFPCVLVRRTKEKHVFACVAAYWDSMAEEFRIDDNNVRDFARSAELFEESEREQGSRKTDRYSLADDARDAARRALSFAEHDAEESREYSERWQQASAKDADREEARADLAANRARAVGLVAVLRATQQTPESRATICTYIREARDGMRRAIEAIRECTDAIHDLDMQGEF